MLRTIAALALSCGLIQAAVGGNTPTHDGYPITRVPFHRVTLTDQFWAPRIETNRAVTVWHEFRECDTTGRIRNSQSADSVLRGLVPNGTFFSYYPFDDSDIYKIIEGASYTLQSTYDAKLDAYLDSIIAIIGRAQEPDGYLYTLRTTKPIKLRHENSWVEKLRKDERWVGARKDGTHEFYNLGHLYEAAVAHYAATGKRSLLDIALKSANLLCTTFGPNGMHTAPGHQVIEMGLVKLSLVTGERKYAELAKFFLDERGHPAGETYNQDHLPVTEQKEAVGHSVRAAYMYAGMADVAMLNNDQAYVKSLNAIWDDVIGTKLYVTGGIGAAGNIEGFGPQYDLPNMNAYCETCAAIANIFWNYRMFLMTGDAKYVDVLERSLYNGFLSGVAMDGKGFFYVNPMEAFKSEVRKPWYGCACCPSNDVRFIPTIPGYQYAQEKDTVFLNLFIAGKASLSVNGQALTVRQESQYPWDGAVAISILPDKPMQCTIALRIPGWATNRPVPSSLYSYADKATDPVRCAVNGEPIPVKTEKGFLRITRTWKAGDRIDLMLPMQVHRVQARAEVKDDRDKVAFERGPFVYCLEGVDQRNGEALNLVIPDTAVVRTGMDATILGGLVTLQMSAFSAARDDRGGVALESGRRATLIPYFARSYRGSSQLSVWPARVATAAKPLPYATVAHLSVLTTSPCDGPEAIADQFVPTSSEDYTVPYCHWWPKKGTQEWMQYDFKKPTTVSSVKVYWFDDTGNGECRVPASWKLFYKAGAEWKPVQTDAIPGCTKDQWNIVHFTPLETSGLRIEMQLQKEFSAGVYEWVVE